MPACSTLARTAKLGWLAPVVVTRASVRSSVAPLLSTQDHASKKSALVTPGALARLTVLLRRTWLGLGLRVRVRARARVRAVEADPALGAIL